MFDDLLRKPHILADNFILIPSFNICLVLSRSLSSVSLRDCLYYENAVYFFCKPIGIQPDDVKNHFTPSKGGVM